MNSGENSNSICTDLILDILSRLPAKSIGRFRCVSKRWASMLSRPHFTELFLTRSLARPRLLLMINRNGDWLFFSSPQPQNPNDKSSLVVAADFHTKFSGGIRQYICSYASGLIYFHDIWISREQVSIICNPITGQYKILPKLTRYWASRSFLGFDPIDKQFKVLFVAYPYSDDEHKILTLGTEKLRWRNIQCSLTHKPVGEGICINGILYYLATQIGVRSYVLVCFDVRWEKFKFIDATHFRDRECTTLINYKGLLGWISLKYGYNGGGKITRKLCMWVLEDVEKQEWSKYVYSSVISTVFRFME